MKKSGKGRFYKPRFNYETFDITNNNIKKMLKETEGVRQYRGEGRRRWFSDDALDLIVWYKADESSIAGFQLCYGKAEAQRAFTWHMDYGYSHNKIDDGEGRPLKHKMSPVLVPDGLLDKESLSKEFIRRAEGIDADIKALVIDKLREYDKV